MKLRKYTIDYYFWEDIKTCICYDMDIDLEQFDNYIVELNHKDKIKDVNMILDYKKSVNLFTEWKSYFDNKENIIENNDTKHFYIDMLLEDKLKQIKTDKKQYLEKFVRSVYSVFSKYNIEYIKY